MAISMYSASVPIFTTMLGNLAKWLEEAEAYASEKKFNSVVLLGTRLAPDMLPFSRQVQIACDGAKFCVARLAGVDAPRFEDNEATVAELKARIAKTLEFVASVTPAQIDGTESKDITIPRRDGSSVMKGEPYLKHYALPNLFFHVTTAYALLRHNGVPLGKGDYLGLSY